MGEGILVKIVVGVGVAVTEGVIVGLTVAADSGVGVGEGVAVGAGGNGVGVRVGEDDGSALVGETSGVTDGMGVTVDVSLDNSGGDGVRVASKTGVAMATGVGLTVATSTDRIVGARSGGGAATPAGSQPIANKEATTARAITGSDPR